MVKFNKPFPTFSEPVRAVLMDRDKMLAAYDNKTIKEAAPERT